MLNGLTRNITTRTRLFIELNIADFVITAVMVNTGMAVEGNPLLGNAIYSIALVKLLVMYLVIRYCRASIVPVLNVGLGLVVIYNLFWFVVLYE